MMKWLNGKRLLVKDHKPQEHSGSGIKRLVLDSDHGTVQIRIITDYE